MIGTIISGLVAAGTAIAGGITAKKNREANKRNLERQAQLNKQAAEDSEKMRQNALLTDPALQVQGYKNAGLGVGSLSPTANSVGGYSAPQSTADVYDSSGISNALQTGLGLYNSINQTKSLKESIRSQKLDNDLKELELDDRRGYHDYFTDWFGGLTESEEFGQVARQHATVRNADGIKQNGGTFRAMNELSQWLEENDSLAQEDKNYQRLCNIKLNKLRLRSPEHFNAIVAMPEYQRRHLLRSIDKMDTENDFLKWKYQNEKDNDFSAWLTDTFGKDARMQSKLALGFFRTLKELFGK